jgi:hypothetical protein
MMMDIASWLREVRMFTNTSDWNAVFVNNRLDEAANEIERLRGENQKQRKRIMLLNSMIQTEHEIIRVAALKEGE